MNYAATYLKKQEHSLQKWASFFREDLQFQFKPLPYDPNISLPLEAYPEGHWNEEEKRQFYYLFVQFNSEALVIFEQCFMYASKKLAHSLKDPTERQAMIHFAKEEFIHTKAFRNYLRKEQLYQFPQNSLLIHRCHRLKQIFAWILKKEPMAIIIPGAKSETYSVFYTKLLEKHFGKDGNTFTRLNALHSEDEVYHIQFDYNFTDSIIQGRSLFGQIKFIFFTFLMIAFIQLIVVLGFNQILKEIRPQTSTWYRAKLMRRIFYWMLWRFNPYIQTRRSMKATYTQRSHFMYKLFRLGSL